MTTTIETIPLTETVGAEIRGVDVDRLLHDDGVPQFVLDTLEANGVLVFRDLHIDDESQVAFSKRLGSVEVFGDGELPEIFRVSLDPRKSKSAAYLKGTFDWHIDGLTDDIPIMATILSAHAVAESGGETEFASTYAAYDTLTDEEKERFDSIKVVHSIEAAQRRLDPDPAPELVEMWRKRPEKEQPLIWRHDDGRHSVVLGPTADHVVGMGQEEGDALLDDILERATSPERVYRHAWNVGDLVIWDNRGVLHRALPYPEDSPRDMHRTTLHGNEAIK
ncbi:MAG: TauD/TfdA family dioxygenase [Acidimicrobiales bacterium]|nr:TauD/TfdA family dioxygenase [Acidimicrobiales bacterium]